MNERDIELAGQNLVNGISNAIEKCVKVAVEAEREACAKVCEKNNTAMADKLAREIRARGNK